MMYQETLEELSQWQITNALGVGGVVPAVHHDCKNILSVLDIVLVIPDDLPLELHQKESDSNLPAWLSKTSSAVLERIAKQSQNGGGITVFGLHELADKCHQGHWFAVPLKRPSGPVAVLLFQTEHHPLLDELQLSWLKAYAGIASLCFTNVLLDEQLRSQGYRDPVSGVYLRRYFIERVVHEAARARRGGWPMSCILLDVDKLTEINQHHGRQAGDNILRQVAGRLMAQLRTGEVIARIEGGTFAIQLAQVTSRAGSLVADRLRVLIEREPFEIDAGKTISVTASFGVSDHMADPSRDFVQIADQLLDDADRAMRHAKKAGRNCVISAVS